MNKKPNQVSTVRAMSYGFAIVATAMTFFAAAGHAQESPIPKYYAAGDPRYGLPGVFDSVESGCSALAVQRPDLSISIPGISTFLGFFITTRAGAFVEGVLPYNSPGVTGWDCYAKYRNLSPVSESTYTFGSVLPTCPPSYTGNVLSPVGADTCPNNAQHSVSAFPKAKAQLGECCKDHAPAPEPMVRHPINAATGNVYTREQDIAQASGSTLSFSRFYNSFDDRVGSLGVGWRHSFSRQVKIVHNVTSPEVYVPTDPHNSSLYQTASDACTSGFAQIQSQVPNWIGASVTYTNDICTISKNGLPFGRLPLSFAYPLLPPPRSSVLGYNVIRDDGSTIWFTNNVGSQPTASPGTTLRLQTTAGGFTVTDANDSFETYDVDGKLLSIVSRSGVVLTLTYNTNQQLLTVSDNFGRTIGLGYDTQGRLLSVADPGLGSTSFGYDDQNRLSTVSRADGSTRGYLYENAAFPTALTGEVDENNSRFSTWTYDAQGRSISTSEAGGAGAGTLTFNADGSVTDTDALGAVRTFTFTRVGDRNVTSSVTGSQCPTCGYGKATAYNDYGWITSRTDYNNNVTQYSYDNARGLETSRTEAYGTPRARTITTQWHATYRLPIQIDEPGRRTTMGYDPAGNLLSRTITDTTTSTSRTWSYTYNSYGQVLTVNGPRTDVNDVTTFTYYTCATGYQCGQVATITNALGQVTTFNTYNAAGQPLTMTDANNVVTTLTYDARQRLTFRAANGETISFEYWPIGQVKKVTLPDGSFIGYSYDNAHRLVGLTDSDGNRLAYTLDANGNRTKEEAFDPSNALTQTHSHVFNQLSQLYQNIGAANTAAVTTTFGYDPNGNPTTVNAPLARNSTSVYDELNRLTSSTDPTAGVTQYSYNSLDQLIAVTDPRSLQTTYTYNALGDLTQQVSPDTGATLNTFDEGGNLKTTTDARNVTETYSYDALNRVTQATYPDQTINYTYDSGSNAAGRISSVADASGSTSWTYTSPGRINSKTQVMGSVSKTVAYTYNSAGQLATQTTPSGKTITYTYANNRIVGIQVNGIPMVSNVLYELFGPTSGWTWGNGSLAVRIYDTDGKLTQLDSAGLNTYGYDDAFRITGITDTADSANSLTFNYDSLDRLTSGTKTGQNQTFTYDANGNRQTQGGTTSSTFTNATTSNRLSSVSGALTKTYIYDNAGNTTSDGTITYGYNAAGRMTSATKSGVTTIYTYNALGQRVTKTTSGVTTYFVYDEAGHILGEYDQTGALIEEIVWLNDTPVATIRSGSCGMAIFYIHTDHLNTPRKITKRSTPDIVWRWDSDAFGTTQANENPSGLGTFAFNLRFPGQYFDQETGNHYNYFRDYDPQSGRYVESDPIRLIGGLNTYTYVNENPISLVDEIGLAGHGIGAGAAENYSSKACGSGWSFSLVPDSFRFGAVSFSSACQRHDRCYGTCGANRGQCDANLRSDMKTACHEKFGYTSMSIACAAQADVYFNKVTEWGDGAFQRAQSNCKGCKK